MSQALPPTIDSIAASVPEGRLSDLLTHLHREGYGHRSQVIRPERGDTASRLRRAGIEGADIDRLAETGQPIVLVFAPHRVESAEVLVLRAGASHVVRYAQSSGSTSALVAFDPSVLLRRTGGRRIGRTPGI